MSDRAEGRATRAVITPGVRNQQKLEQAFAPHVESLNDRVDALRTVYGQVPYFDPDDGGKHATVLVLLESPGPSRLTVRFVSRDNPGPSQRNLERYLREAQIPRKRTVLWNTVPWVIRAEGERSRPLRRAEIATGLQILGAIIPLLGSLKIVVMAGRIAQQADPYLRRSHPHLRLYCMPHPSPLSVCVSPSVGARIRAVLNEVTEQLAPRGADQHN